VNKHTLALHPNASGVCMGSSFRSALAQLDESLQAIESEISGLQGGLETSEDQLWQSLELAQLSAATLRTLILEQRPDANWANREDLLLLIDDLEQETAQAVIDERRQKLIDLADELNAGKIKHRVESRAAALNELRAAAIDELRAEAALAEPTKDLPGPDAADWICWVCNLQEGSDADDVAALHESFSALEQFATEMEERYWVPPEPGYERRAPVASSPAPPKPRVVKTERPTVKSVTVINPKPAAIEIKTPVADPKADKAFAETTEESAEALAEASPVVVAEQSDAEVGSAPISDFTFGVDASPRKPVAVWIAAGIVALVGLTLLGVHYFGSKSSDKSDAVAAAESPGGATQGSVGSAGSPTQVKDPAHPAAVGAAGHQPIEGAQKQILLNVEQCLRVVTGNVECKGYVKNLGAQVSRVTLDGVDVVDGKGNSFNLNSNGQVNFSTGRSSNIEAGAREAYTVKVPDKDPDARTLTLYVDVNNPHGLEYTFRDVPILVEQSRNGG
jgi:hypothetical protein